MNQLDTADYCIRQLEASVLKTINEARQAVLTARQEVERREAELEKKRRIENYTEQEAAELLKVSVKTLREQRVRYNLPHQRFGVAVRYSHEQLTEIQRILEKGKRKKGE